MPSRGFTSNCQNLVGHRVTDGSYALVFEAVLGVGAYGVVYKARNLACHGPEFFGTSTVSHRLPLSHPFPARPPLVLRLTVCPSLALP